MIKILKRPKGLCFFTLELDILHCPEQILLQELLAQPGVCGSISTLQSPTCYRREGVRTLVEGYLLGPVFVISQRSQPLL